MSGLGGLNKSPQGVVVGQVVVVGREVPLAAAPPGGFVVAMTPDKSNPAAAVVVSSPDLDTHRPS